MGAIAIALVIIPFAFVGDWFGHLKKLPALDMELSRASHGAFLIIAAIRMPSYFAIFGWQAPSLLCLGLGGWGLFWLFVGSTRSRHIRDGHLLTRAIIKVGLGIVIWVISTRWPLDNLPEFFLWKAAGIVSAWCVITGLTKTILQLRPLPQLDINPAHQTPFGNVPFSGGGGLDASANQPPGFSTGDGLSAPPQEHQ
jgi:hypothetical protein